MDSASAHHDLIARLEALRIEYEEMTRSAIEVEARGYTALLGSTVFTERARDRRNRAVPLFERLARALSSAGVAPDVRLHLLQASRQIAALFDDGAPAPRGRHRIATAAPLPDPTLRDLLDAIRRVSPADGGMSLHDRVLHLAAAADNARRARLSSATRSRERGASSPPSSSE